MSATWRALFHQVDQSVIKARRPLFTVAQGNAQWCQRRVKQNSRTVLAVGISSRSPVRQLAAIAVPLALQTLLTLITRTRHSESL